MVSYKSGSGVHKDSATDSYYASPRPEMAALLPKTCKRVIDVGCGAGAFAASLKSLPQVEEVWGVEINEAVGQMAREQLDRVLIGDISELLEQLPEKYFDAVFFNDVLEHMVDPYSLLEQIKKHLAPGASVLISLPNVRYIRNLFDFLVHKDWQYQDRGILDRTHLRFFTKKSAERMIADAGYQLQFSQGIEATKKWYMPVLNVLTAGYFRDTFYLQYVFRAQLVQ